MKTKLLLFLGLAIASASLAVVFDAAPAHAEGEKYEWANANSIKVSEYNIDGINTGRNYTFNKNGATYQAKIEGSCDVTLTITPSGDNTTGTLAVPDTHDSLCNDALKDLDKTFSIAHPERGPVADGAEVNYATVNCTEYYEGGENVLRCQAIKKCFVTAKKTVNECLNAWNTCIANNTTAGAITEANRTKCSEAVGKGDFAAATKPAAANNKTSCAVVGIGWIVCPVLTFLAQIVDASYGIISSLLTIQPLFSPGSGGDASAAGVYNAWSIMRNFANVSFVIAFLVIIFSQLSGVGLTNYGLKKMLPQLIISAVFVNGSFWICAAAIDLSNITGKSIYELLNGVKDGITFPNAGDFGATGTGWTGIVGGVLAGTIAAGAALYVGLAALLPALVAVGGTIVTVLLVLVFRQALAIILVVVSPLAFVMRLLPNTEGVYKKFLGLGKVVLIMYPTVGLVFGGAGLASTIVMSSVSPKDPYKLPIQVMGAALAVIPLVIVPTLMKGITSVMGRFGAVLDNPNKGPIDSLRKKAEGYRDKRNDIQTTRRINGTNAFGIDGSSIRGNGSSRFRRVAGSIVGAPNRIASNRAVNSMDKELQAANAKKALNDAKQEYVADRISSGDAAYAQKVAGPTGDVERITSQAIATVKNETAQAIKDVEISADIKPGQEGLDEMATILGNAIRDNDDVTARAMQNMLLTSGSAGLKKYRETMTTKEDDIDPATGVGRALSENMLKNHSAVKGTANDLVQQAVTGKKMSAVSSDPNTWKLSDEELVHQKPDSQKLAISSGAVDKEQALRILANDQLIKHVDKDIRAKIETISTTP